jgi:hypothetical protein
VPRKEQLVQIPKCLSKSELAILEIAANRLYLTPGQLARQIINNYLDNNEVAITELAKQETTGKR